MFKKSFSLIVVLILLLTAAVGCGGGGNSKAASSGSGSSGGSGGSSGSSSASTQKSSKPGKLVIWDKSEYVKSYNDMNKKRAEAFGKKYNVKVDYVIVSPNDLKTKLNAAIEAGNPPDIVAIDDFVAKQYTGRNLLVPVDDVLKSLPFRKSALLLAKSKDGNFEVPEGFIPNIMYVRKDKWEAAGQKLPTTWAEVEATAKKVNDPKHNFYALGFPLGASGGGDAENWLSHIILDWGGRFVDKDGNVTVNSPESLAGLKFAAKLYKEKLVPKSAATGNDMWNNNAWAAGTIGLTFNSGSILAAMRKGNQKLLKETAIMPFPAGPKGDFGSGGEDVFMIFKKGGNTDNAKKFIKFFFDHDYYQKLVEGMLGEFVPVVSGYKDTKFWQDNSGWYNATNNIIPLGWPGPANTAASEVTSQQIVTKQVQRMVLQNLPAQKALDNIEAQYKKIYAQYKSK